ncbi:MAG: Inositol 2-dehydrogenase/D-chiro-inositol 3-dehydrogenase [Chroococcopsis gigantea SAG 12.99]|jgi:biliverdin reductase|nr:Gfo/Idh/MocA family oxidoreductase [Chlorogloea purpurea SAG 13.99]MDV2999435.1 Inositol 2-dehydrogenase/D-chiro-inositol 3-dehydrogenase [Chroococcopsis gigantea SAG 12.99]
MVNEERLLRVGIIGTGFAASRRAEAFNNDERAKLLFASGYDENNLTSFCGQYGVAPLESSEALTDHPDVDLVVIANVNEEHDRLVRRALEAKKHVIVEYPLSFDPESAENLIQLAKTGERLLHVEHIELLGGLHQSQQKYLSEIGNVFAANYATVTPARPAPRRWTFHKGLFGFPLIAALSRIHRLTNLFGTVESVSSHCRYWDAPEEEYFIACLCTAQLRFHNGIIAGVGYGKGEVFWKDDRTFSIHGDRGSLVYVGETGHLVRDSEEKPLEVGTKRGLFAKDTTMVLDHLYNGSSLYVRAEESLYALKVAHAAYRSALSQETEKV